MYTASGVAPLPIVLAGTFMVVLDFFIVNVALPSMQARLHASDGAIEWIVAGYSLTSAVLLIAAGRLGDRHGRRRIFALGVALFTLSSAACGLAGGPGMLVGARLVQGGAAALLMPNVLSLIGVLYDGVDRARALAAYGMTMGLAAVSGQLIGGVLVQADIAGLGWRTVFLINVPVGAVALALAPRLIPESRVPGRGRVDLTGTLLVTAGLTAIVLPLVEGRTHGWPLWTWLSLAGSWATRPAVNPRAPNSSPEMSGEGWRRCWTGEHGQDRRGLLVRPGVLLPRPGAVTTTVPSSRSSARSPRSAPPST
jgi:MFS family permease